MTKYYNKHNKYCTPTCNYDSTTDKQPQDGVCKGFIDYFDCTNPIRSDLKITNMTCQASGSDPNLGGKCHINQDKSGGASGGAKKCTTDADCSKCKGDTCKLHNNMCNVTQSDGTCLKCTIPHCTQCSNTNYCDLGKCEKGYAPESKQGKGCYKK